jgi:hypothetical protein
MTIVVGASRDDDNEKGVDSGSAYVFEKVGNAWEQKAKLTSSGSVYVFEKDSSTWKHKDKLTASDGAMFHQFGESVAISGDKIVVGGYSSGYVFEKVDSTWIQKHKLYPL